MKNLKNNTMALVALAIAGTSVTLMSFSKNSNEKIAMQWYEVTPHPSNPNQDEIGEPIPDPTESGACSTTKTKDRCAIQLDLDGASESPETVEDALSDPNVTVGQSTFRNN